MFYLCQKQDIGLDRVAALDEEHYVKVESNVLESDIMWTALKNSLGLMGDVRPPWPAASFPLEDLGTVTQEMLAKVTQALPTKVNKKSRQTKVSKEIWKRGGLPSPCPPSMHWAWSMSTGIQKQRISERNWVELSMCSD